MSKSHKKYMEKRGYIWQVAQMESASYLFYRTWLHSLALNRFKWHNLPPTVDERYLEWLLFYQGQATIAHPVGAPSVVLGLTAVQDGIPNIYDTPSKWFTQGANGKARFHVTDRNGAMIFDNRLRLPIAPKLDLIANRLAAVDRTIDVNLANQRVPALFTAPKEKVQDLTNLYKQVNNGEPAVLGLETINMIGVSKIDPEIPFIGLELDELKQRYIRDAFMILGIPSMEKKAERLITTEAQAQTEPADLMALDGLTARMQACKKLNEIGVTHDLYVTWNRDNASDAFDFTVNPLLKNGLDA